MATFNVTQHGVDNPFKWATTPVASSETTGHTSTETSPSDIEEQQDYKIQGTASANRVTSSARSTTSGCTLPPIPSQYPPLTTLVAGNTADRPRKFESLPLHHGSHQKFSEIKTKHRRDVRGPNEHYPRRTLTTAQDYGQWMQTCPPGDEPWVAVHRRPLVNSEMTRFVDEMALTNKDFTLF